jgi:GAF domain-containing protein
VDRPRNMIIGCQHESGDAVPDVEEQPGPDTALARAPARTSRSLDRLDQLRQLIEQASPDHGLPQLLVTEAASAAGAASAVLGALSGDRLLELTWAADPSSGQEAAPDAVPLALSIATAVTQPVWLSSRAELAWRFPRLADVPAPGELACAVLPLPADGVRLGFLALMFAGPRDFDPREREYLLSLADEAALGLSRSRPAGPLRPAHRPPGCCWGWRPPTGRRARSVTPPAVTWCCTPTAWSSGGTTPASGPASPG